jgi:hypothetical protein
MGEGRWSGGPDAHGAGRLPAGFDEAFRYSKCGRTRVYGLRSGPGDVAQLWVVSWGSGRVAAPRQLATFERLGDVEPFARAVEQELRLGGWSRV